MYSGLAAVGLSGVGLFVAYLVREEVYFVAPFLVSLFLIVVGLLSGIVGLFVKRAFAGLLFNLLLVFAVYQFFVYMMTTCCARPLPVS